MFVTLMFPACFAALALAWYLVPARSRWLAALLGSLAFYLLWCPGGVPLLAGAAALCWQAALRMERAGGRARTGWLLAGLAGAFVPLVLSRFFAAAAPWSLLAPLGISYYSLALAGYLADVRQGKTPAEKNYGRVLCFALFFLSIVQGPINRYNALMPQLEQPVRFQKTQAVFGLQRMAWGYFQKFAIADRLAGPVDTVFSGYAGMDCSQLIFGIVGYSLQLYADFAGYTNIALGAGQVLGLQLPENFCQPYFSQTAGGFWRRWHISLSFWFRDYVYIPLGGSRHGTLCRLRSLLAVWLLTGVWHGFGSSFIAWGLYWFCLVAAGSFLPKPRPGGAAVRVLRALRTSALACFGWLLFRADTLGTAVAYLRAIAQNPGHRVLKNYWELGITNRYGVLMLLLGIFVLLAVDLLRERGHSLRTELAQKALPVRWAVYQAAIWAFLFMGVFLTGGTGTFLYARF